MVPHLNWDEIFWGLSLPAESDKMLADFGEKLSVQWINKRSMVMEIKRSFGLYKNTASLSVLLNHYI